MERFKAPEILFNPEQIGLEYAGVHQVIVDSINRVDLDLRKNLFSNIVLSGGSTLCTGFGDRLLNEVKKLAIKDVKIRIYAPPERKYSTWIGGSILAGLATFKKVLIYHAGLFYGIYPLHRCGSAQRSIKRTPKLYIKRQAFRMARVIPFTSRVVMSYFFLNHRFFTCIRSPYDHATGIIYSFDIWMDSGRSNVTEKRWSSRRVNTGLATERSKNAWS